MMGRSAQSKTFPLRPNHAQYPCVPLEFDTQSPRQIKEFTAAASHLTKNTFSVHVVSQMLMSLIASVPLPQGACINCSAQNTRYPIDVSFHVLAAAWIKANYSCL